MVRLLRHCLALPLLVTASTAVRAGEAECQAVVAAFTRLAEAPAYRQSMSLPGQPAMEMAAIGDTLYMNAGENWQKLPLKAGGRKEIMRQIVGEKPLENCEAGGTEQVGGQAADMFAYRVPPIEGLSPEPSDQRVWIAQADGLPLRMLSADGVDVMISYAPFEPPVP